MKGRTKWFPRYVHPIRCGLYECLVRLGGGMHTHWHLKWDGIGFQTPTPMSVKKWRGLTRQAFIKGQTK